jgi:type IV pilus assembly protein PilC
MALEDWFVAHARVSSKAHKKCKMDDKMTFFQQLSTLTVAGTPLLQAIKICAQQSQSTRLQRTLEEVAGRVAAGSSLHSAAGYYPNIFENHWIEVIRTGEITGKMGPVLLDLNRQIRESRETRRKVVGSLMYPAILIVFAICAVTIMLWLVVPTFAKMFKDMGAELPGITQFVVDASGFVVKYGIYCLLGVVVVALAFRKYMKTEGGRRRVGALGLAVPLVGRLMVEAAMYRFASNLALLLKSGIPMIETLSALGKVFHSSPIYRDAIARVQTRVASGRPLASSLEETGLFTSMMTNMVRIGEGSGQLSEVMNQVAPYYKERMEGLVSKVTKLLEPIIIVGMGTTIAGLMMSIYLPMFEMAGKVH